MTETFGTGDIDPFDVAVPTVLDGLASLSRTSGHTPAELSLAWLLRKPGIASVAVGVSSAEQFASNLRVTGVELADDVMAELDRLSDRIRPYPHTMQEYAFQEMVHGAEELAALEPPARWVRSTRSA